MSPLEDSTPEEMKPENQQMLALLRTFSRKSSTASAEEQTQAMERIQQRLARALVEEGHEKGAEGSGVWQESRQYPKPKQIRALHPLMARMSLVAAVLVVAVIVGSTALVLNLGRQQRTTVQGGHTLPSRIFVSGTSIACLDGKTGKVLWQYSESSRLPSGLPWPVSFWGPVITSDSVYAVADVGDQGGDVYAFNAQNGTIRWKRALDSNHGVNQALLVDGTLYVNAVDSADSTVSNHHVYVYALNPRDGTIKKRYSVATTPAGYVEDMIHSAIANGVLYITTSNNVYALDLATGAQIWHQQEHLEQKFYGVQVLQGVVYTSSFEMFVQGQPDEGGGHAYAYDARTGAPIWKSAPIANSSDALLGVVGQSVYVLAGTDLLALDRGTGKERWSYSTASSSGPGDILDLDGRIPPLVDGNTVYVAERDFKTNATTIVALNVTDGSNRWKQPPHFEVIQVADGIIYAADRQGHVMALRASDHKELWKGQISMPQGSPGGAYYNEAVIVP